MLQRGNRLIGGLIQLKKTLVKGMLIMLASSLAFSHISVFATSTPATAEAPQKTQAEVENELITDALGTFSFFSQGVYLLLWPFVALAGLAMDNNLVYGSYLRLDSPLWQVWTIVKNLANFILGFIFLYEILHYVLNSDRKMGKTSSPGDLIKKSLMAGVLIQLSWFIMMVAVDVSSVLTYTVGALPTTLLSQSDAQMDTKIAGVSVWSNLGTIAGNGTQDDKALSYYLTLSGASNAKNVAPCKLVAVKIDGKEQQLILGREFLVLGSGNAKATMEPGYCFHNGEIYSYSEWNTATDAQTRTKNQNIRMESLKGKDAEKNAKEYLKAYQALSLTQKFEPGNGPADCKYIGPIPNTPIKAEEKAGSQTPSTSGQKKYYCLYDTHGMSLSDLTQRATGRTGPFMALYGNMISFAHINESHGIKQQLMEVAINTLFLVAVFLPLAMLVVVLFWRIFQLWMAIALSPLIVLANVFDKMPGLGDLAKNKTMAEVFNLDNLKNWLLAPVFIGFALSISLMFMTILKTSIHPGETQEAQNAVNQGITSLTGMKCGGVGETTCDLMGFIKITFSSAVIDLYSLLISLFGVALSWILLFWAIKQTSIGKDRGAKLQQLGEEFITTSPIMPVAGTKVGLGALSRIPDQVLDKQISAFEAQRTADVRFLLGDKDETRKRNAEVLLKNKSLTKEYQQIIDNPTEDQDEAKVKIAELYSNATPDDIKTINTVFRKPYFDKNQVTERDNKNPFTRLNVDKQYRDGIMSEFDQSSKERIAYEKWKAQQKQNTQNTKTT